MAHPDDAGPLLAIDDLGFGYQPGSLVIDGLSIEVEAGEIVSVVGPSGCGKSSLLRVVSGLSRPTRGEVRAYYRRPDQHGLSMVFQEDTLLPWMRVRDNVGLHHRYRGRARSRESRARVRELLAMVGLEDKANAYPSQLSGGMRRRVAILTALAADPELLLLDEPFSALDEPTRVGVHRDLYRLVRRAGASVLLVTHDLGEAISLSDRVLLLSRPPATVADEFRVPFPADRDVRTIRSHPDFLHLYARLWDSLEAQIGPALGMSR